jgi:hypothetical protein
MFQIGDRRVQIAHPQSNSIHSRFGTLKARIVAMETHTSHIVKGGCYHGPPPDEPVRGSSRLMAVLIGAFFLVIIILDVVTIWKKH